MASRPATNTNNGALIEATYIVKLEFVQYALTLSRPLPSSFTPSSLARIVMDAGTSNLFFLSLEKWISYGQSFLGLDVRACRALFDRFLFSRDDRESVLESTRAQLSYEEMNNQAAHTHELQKTVPTPTFIMFLYLQLFQRTSTNPAVQINSGDSWLGGSHARTIALTQRTQDSDAFLTFLRRHLYDLILCASMGQYKISLEHIRNLAFLFHEYPPSGEFGSEIPLWKQNASQTVEISTLHPYMQQHVSSSAAWYPPLELPVVKGKSRIVWPDPGCTPATRVAVLARVKGVFSKTVPLPAYVSQLSISSSHSCTLYLLCPLPHVSIVGCSSCTIVLGAVSGVLTIEECDNVIVMATCSATHISNSTDLTLNLCSNTSPIVVGDSRDIQFAPYNTFYNMLEADMRTSGINPLLSKVLSFQNLSTTPSKSNVLGMAPRDFTSSIIPLSAPPRSSVAPVTVANPCWLPKDYAEVIQQRVETFTRTLLCVQKALGTLHAEGTERSLQAATQLRSKIEARFALWVAQTGQQKSVLDMIQV